MATKYEDTEPTMADLEPAQSEASVLKYALGDCLTKLEAPASFALFEPLTNVPLPGLILSHYGSIGLPLSFRDANALQAMCREGLHGYYTPAKLAEAERLHAWEIPRNGFSLQNPTCQSFIESAVAKVSTGLGLGAFGTITAEIRELTLYEEGAIARYPEKYGHQLSSTV